MELTKTYRLGLSMALLIILVPLLNYAHLFFSETNNSISILNFTIAHELNNNQFWAWSFMNYLIQLIFLMLLYFSTESFFRFFLFPIISLAVLSLLSLLEIIPNLYDTPISITILLITIFSTLIIYSLDYKRRSEFHTVIVNKIVSESLLNWFNSSLKNGITRLLRLKEEQKNVSAHKFLRKAVFLKIALQEKHAFLLSQRKEESLHRAKYFEWGVYLIIGLIYISWFIPYFVPEELKTIHFLGFEISSSGFNDVSLLIWFVSRKLVIIFILSLWFVTSPYWWKYAIFCPLIIYSYQFWEAFQDVTELDSVGNLRVFPLVLLNVVLVILISRVVKYRAQFIAVYEEISREVDEMLNEMKSKYPQEVGATLERIRQGKKGKKNRRQQLKALEEEIAARLDLTKG